MALTVQMKSAGVGTPEVDAELIKPEWFDVARHPEARFVASQVKIVGAGRYEVQGQFSLKGQTRPLALQLALTQAGALSTASGSFTLKRSEWQIGSGEWADTSIVANEVLVRFKFPFSGMAPR